VIDVKEIQIKMENKATDCKNCNGTGCIVCDGVGKVIDTSPVIEINPDGYVEPVKP